MQKYNQNTTSWQPPESSLQLKRDTSQMSSSVNTEFFCAYKLDNSYVQRFNNLCEGDWKFLPAGALGISLWSKAAAKGLKALHANRQSL